MAAGFLTHCRRRCSPHVVNRSVQYGDAMKGEFPHPPGSSVCGCFWAALQDAKVFFSLAFCVVGTITAASLRSCAQVTAHVKTPSQRCQTGSNETRVFINERIFILCYNDHMLNLESSLLFLSGLKSIHKSDTDSFSVNNLCIETKQTYSQCFQ